jgi:hypothetical protein
MTYIGFKAQNSWDWRLTASPSRPDRLRELAEHIE